MTGLKIKRGDCIRAPGCETFVLKDAAGIGRPDGLTEGFGDMLLPVRFMCGLQEGVGEGLHRGLYWKYRGLV